MILGWPMAIAALTLVAAANPAPYAVRDIGSAPASTAPTSGEMPAASSDLFKISDIDAAPTPGRSPVSGHTATAPEDLFKISEVSPR